MNSKSSSLSLTGLLFLLFVGLKLTGHVDWSWWWVTAPLWMPIGVVILVLAVGMLLVAEGEKKRKRY